jgi:hypothetical protein
MTPAGAPRRGASRGWWMVLAGLLLVLLLLALAAAAGAVALYDAGLSALHGLGPDFRIVINDRPVAMPTLLLAEHPLAVIAILAVLLFALALLLVLVVPTLLLFAGGVLLVALSPLLLFGALLWLVLAPGKPPATAAPMATPEPAAGAAPPAVH